MWTNLCERRFVFYDVPLKEVEEKLDGVGDRRDEFVWYQSVLPFSKLNKMFFGYFDPEKIFLDDENK